MGLLDDAIRQHLELKRRHGADPSTVAKLEHEAFGPIEREDALGVEEPGGPEPDLAAAAHETAAEEEHAYADAEQEADASWAAAHPEPAASVALEPEAPAGEPAPPPPLAPPEPAAEPPAPPPAPGGSVRLDEQPGERTVEFSALEPEPEPRPDAEPGDHDELEQTPEFLQETPEHDRLWFEQKPPRDFDF